VITSLRPLIVEKDPNFSHLLRRGLAKAGVGPSQAYFASDGDEAIRILSEREEPPSFVILDLHLPKRSGLDVLEWIRSIPRFSSLHVFMMTVDSTPESVSRAFELGVSSYFIKPAHVDDLDGLLAGIIAYTHRRAATSPKGPLA
jgi:DNA-binding response OmpR family regulator